ncbi:MAG: Uma2 family endonuclease [Fimbriiglobus sp.]
MIVRYQPETAVAETLADLVDRLGGVPLSRIRLKPAPGTATEADLDKPETVLCELIDGTLVEKAMGTRESMLGLYIGGLISVHIRFDQDGIVLGGDGFIRLGPGLVRGPDVTFIPWSAFPDEVLPEEAFWTVGPGLMVEVLSEGNRPGEINRKLREFFAAKCKLAWIIDPATKTARVHTSATKFKTLDETGTLDGGKVLPGFTLPLAELFAVGQRKKNS